MREEKVCFKSVHLIEMHAILWQTVAMKMTMFIEHLWAVNDEGIKC